MTKQESHYLYYCYRLTSSYLVFKFEIIHSQLTSSNNIIVFNKYYSIFNVHFLCDILAYVELKLK